MKRAIPLFHLLMAIASIHVGWSIHWIGWIFAAMFTVGFVGYSIKYWSETE